MDERGRPDAGVGKTAPPSGGQRFLKRDGKRRGAAGRYAGDCF